MNYFRILFLFLILTARLTAEEPESKLELTAGLSLGRADYEEKGRSLPVESDWTATQVEAMVRAGWSFSSYELRGTLRLSESREEAETWTLDGERVQRNDLRVTSVFADVELGLHDTGERRFFLTPLVGILHGAQFYDRSDFISLDGEPRFTDATVTEEVETFSSTLGLLGRVGLRDRLTWEYRAEAAWVLWSEAYNDGFRSRIDGEGGWSVSLQTSVWYQLKSPGHRLGVQVRGFRQKLDGDIDEFLDVEWPDNEWNAWSVGVSYSILL